MTDERTEPDLNAEVLQTLKSLIAARVQCRLLGVFVSLKIIQRLFAFTKGCATNGMTF